MAVMDVLAVCFTGCPGARPPGAAGEGLASPGQAVVARIAGAPVLAREIALDAALRGVTVRAALEDRIRLELFALAAEQSSRPTSTVVDRTLLQSAEVERLLAAEVEPQLRKSAIPPAEVHAMYDRGLQRFVHGRLVQVAVLCIFTGARLPAEPRARAEQNAGLLRDHVIHHPGTAADFAALSKAPLWLQRNVSFTIVWQGRSEPFPAVVGEATSRLTSPGDTTDLVGDDSGYYLARYIAERAPENVSFADARAELEGAMYEPWRRQRFLQISRQMAQAHDVEVFPQNFAQLTATPAAATP
jgi:hypothetical protein